LSTETYQYITLISFEGSLSSGEEGSLCFGERGHLQLAKGTFLIWPDRVILVCFIQPGVLRLKRSPAGHRTKAIYWFILVWSKNKKRRK